MIVGQRGAARPVGWLSAVERMGVWRRLVACSVAARWLWQNAAIMGLYKTTSSSFLGFLKDFNETKFFLLSIFEGLFRWEMRLLRLIFFFSRLFSFRNFVFQGMWSWILQKFNILVKVLTLCRWIMLGYIMDVYMVRVYTRYTSWRWRIYGQAWRYLLYFVVSFAYLTCISQKYTRMQDDF